jgi:Na+-translocating ferredoxin:NAD+ oxidoreductase RNF subunit RnfB
MSKTTPDLMRECGCILCIRMLQARAYQAAPLLLGYGLSGMCIGCGFKHHPNYPDCVWLKDI